MISRSPDQFGGDDGTESWTEEYEQQYISVVVHVRKDGVYNHGDGILCTPALSMGKLKAGVQCGRYIGFEVSLD